MPESSRTNSFFSGGREAREQDIAESEMQAERVSTESIELDDGLNRAPATWKSLSWFTYYSQEQSYSCGPASVRMALKYFLPSATYAESTVRTGCKTTTSGTYLSDMNTYTNYEIRSGSFAYLTKYGANKTTMKDNLYNCIVTYSAPPIIGLKESTSNGWAFNLPAHFVAMYSIMSDKSDISLCDPWAGYDSSSSPHKWLIKSADDVYTAYSAVNLGYMY